MPENRDPVDFSNLNLGIDSTTELADDALESFLGGDPDEVTKNTPEEKPISPTPPVKEAPKKQAAKPEAPKEEAPSGDELLEGLLDEDGEEAKTETPKKEAEGTQLPDNQDDNPFNAIGKQLLDLGIFTLDEGETAEDLSFDNGETFKDRWVHEQKKGVSSTLDSFLGKFGEGYREMFEDVFINGMPPLEYLGRVAKINQVASIDLEDESNQERIVREKLHSVDGLSVEKIDARINKLKGYGDLKEESETAKEILLDREQKEAQAASDKKIQENTAAQQREQQYVQTVNKILVEKMGAKEYDGIPVDTKFAKETFDYLVKKDYKLTDGTTLTSFDKDLLDLKKPENYALKVKMAMLLRMVKTDPTLSKIQKKAVSKETNVLFGDLSRKATKTNANKSTTNTDPKRGFFD